MAASESPVHGSNWLAMLRAFLASVVLKNEFLPNYFLNRKGRGVVVLSTDYGVRYCDSDVPCK